MWLRVSVRLIDIKCDMNDILNSYEPELRENAAKESSYSEDGEGACRDTRWMELRVCDIG